METRTEGDLGQGKHLERLLRRQDEVSDPLLEDHRRYFREPPRTLVSPVDRADMNVPFEIVVGRRGRQVPCIVVPGADSMSRQPLLDQRSDPRLGQKRVRSQDLVAKPGPDLEQPHRLSATWRILNNRKW